MDRRLFLAGVARQRSRRRQQDPSTPVPRVCYAAKAPPASGPEEWEKRNAATLQSTTMKKGLKLFWFSTGKDDFLLGNTVAAVDV
jgi:hypothetical protein